MTRLALLLVPFIGLSFAHAADLPEAPLAATPPTIARVQSSAGTQTFLACRNAIAEWAQPYSPVDMEVVSVGRVQRYLDGTRVAPLYVRIVYEVEGGYETRKADVKCTIDRADTIAVVPTPRN